MFRRGNFVYIDDLIFFSFINFISLNLQLKLNIRKVITYCVSNTQWEVYSQPLSAYSRECRMCELICVADTTLQQ